MIAKGLDHVVVAVNDVDVARTQYVRVFGKEAVADIIDAEGYRRCVIRLGDQRLELCQPFGPVGDGSSQASLAFRSTLESRGEGIHNVAVEVAGLDAVLAGLHAAGIPLIESALSHSFFVHPRALSGALVQFVESSR